MQNREIELKFPVSDPAALQGLLPQFGFHLDTPRTFEQNTLYDTPNRDLRARTEILRIRQYGPVWTVTHKRTARPGDMTESSRYKVRIETETAVADGPALGHIFESLGYTPAFTYEKYRTEWSAIDATTNSTPHLVIDETPIGTYAELEGPTEWIDRMLAALKIDTSTCLTDSYGKLFLDWKQRTGSAAENLTFAEIAAHDLVAID
ncbi:MAG: class IV adenylate cyclase [Acidobacteria bacterium]|nr:class IV adenylate cyclase [Acidobacteriota bacterium]